MGEVIDRWSDSDRAKVEEDDCEQRGRSVCRRQCLMGVMSQRVVPGTFLRGTYLKSSYFAFLNPRVNKFNINACHRH